MLAAPPLASLVRVQHGCVTRDQLVESGMSRSTQRRRIADGSLVVVGRQTFRLATAPGSPLCRLMAACLDHDAVASHRSAAWLHGLVPDPPSPVEVLVAKGGAVRPGLTCGATVRVRSTTSLPLDDRTEVRGVPTVSLARAVLGLAAEVSRSDDRDELAAIVEAAVREGRATDTWLWWLLEKRRCSGRNGVREMEDVLAVRAALGPTESWLEREALTLLAEAGLPSPTLQRRIRRRGRFVARVDLAYVSARVVIEVLGHAHHSSRAQLRADTERANELQLAGWVVIQITYDQMVNDPASVVRTVRDALIARAVLGLD